MAELTKKEMDSLFESMNAANPSQTRAAKQFIFDNYDFVNKSLRDYSIPSFVAALEDKGIFKTNVVAFRCALKQVRTMKGEENMYRKRAVRKNAESAEDIEVDEAV